MTRPTDRRISARLTPEGTFVIQLRANSDVRQRRLHGRVEHVMSGQSVQFTSLARLLDFMGRYHGASSLDGKERNSE